MGIGQKIKEVFQQKGMSKTELGKRLNMTSTNVHKIFLRETIDTGLLQRISAILEFDFFIYYKSVQDDGGKPVYKKLSVVTEEEFMQITKELTDSRRECEYLKEINSLLRDKISFLEGKAS